MTVTIADIRAAAARFDTHVRRTPLLPSATLSAMLDAEVRLKAENLQRTGSFKIRGAITRIAALSADERARGIIAASAGNHAQGVAIAAAAARVHATIVMPVNAPLAKVQSTREYGAEIVLSGESYDEAAAEAGRIAAARRLVAIPAFDDPLVVAGQGTVGLEIVEDWPEVEAVVVPVGGGGLAAGVGVAARALAPRTRLIGVQAEAAPGVKRSLAGGSQLIAPPAPTIADGIAVGGPGHVTFPLLQRCIDDIVTVAEDSIAQAMVLLLERSKLVVEGAGAAGAAALMSHAVDLSGKRVAIVLSGGNVDINMLARVVEHGLTQAGRYVTLTVGLDDKPGQLAALTSVLSTTGANILSVAHHRFGIDLAVGRVQVVLLLEVRNRAHGDDVARTLERSGFARRRGQTPEFVPAVWGSAEGR